MERPAVLELMVKLKLRGMRAAYDEVMTLAAKRHHPPERIVGELLAAQLELDHQLEDGGALHHAPTVARKPS